MAGRSSHAVTYQPSASRSIDALTGCEAAQSIFAELFAVGSHDRGVDTGCFHLAHAGEGGCAGSVNFCFKRSSGTCSQRIG